ncbi:MAG: hypothetical protein J7M25_05780, partial [Deltaproteobacteria bacterium]|nr:hypothetical protein [Deltaproteobacteria bacterium]
DGWGKLTFSDQTVGPGDCPEGQTDCDGTCVDLQSDDANCGRCGNICPEGTQCSNGRCIQPGDGGVTDGNTDPRGCGCSSNPTNNNTALLMFLLLGILVVARKKNGHDARKLLQEGREER